MPGQQRRKLRPDELVAMGEKERGTTGTAVLKGFLGESPREGFLRLYLTTTLDEYVEFPEDAVLDSRQKTPEESAIGGTTIWLDRSTLVTQTKTRSRETQAWFLQGDVVSRAIGGVPKWDFPEGGGGWEIPEGGGGIGTTLTTVTVTVTITITIPGTRASYCTCPTKDASCDSKISVCLCSFEPCSVGGDCI